MISCRLQKYLFQNIISGIPQECQTVWIQIRPDEMSGLIWFQTVCKGLIWFQTVCKGPQQVKSWCIILWEKLGNIEDNDALFHTKQSLICMSLWDLCPACSVILSLTRDRSVKCTWFSVADNEQNMIHVYVFQVAIYYIVLFVWVFLFFFFLCFCFFIYNVWCSKNFG